MNCGECHNCGREVAGATNEYHQPFGSVGWIVFRCSNCYMKSVRAAERKAYLDKQRAEEETRRLRNELRRGEGLNCFSQTMVTARDR